MDIQNWKSALTRKRRGIQASEILGLIVVFTVGAILVGSVLINGLGTLANGTQGNACKNCDSTTKALLPNVNVFIVLGVMMAFIGAGLAVFIGHKKGTF